LLAVAQLCLEEVFKNLVRLQLRHIVPGVFLDQEQHDAHDSRLLHGCQNAWLLEAHDSLQKLDGSQLDLSKREDPALIELILNRLKGIFFENGLDWLNHLQHKFQNGRVVAIFIVIIFIVAQLNSDDIVVIPIVIPPIVIIALLLALNKLFDEVGDQALRLKAALLIALVASRRCHSKGRIENLLHVVALGQDSKELLLLHHFL